MRGVKDVQGWLSRHGVTASCSVIPLTGSVPAQLEALASKQGADLVVAGAYRHNRWRELILGGVTRALITRAKHCSLLAH